MNRKLRPSVKPPGMLLGCCLAMAAFVGLEWRQFANANPAPDAAPLTAAAAPAAAALATFDPPPADRFAEIAQRPLFVPERRPQDDDDQAKPTPPPNAPALAVQGVVLSPEGRYAVIQHGTPPKLDAIAEGATVEGWQIEHIDAQRVALRAGTATVEFPVGKSVKGAAGATQPPPVKRHAWTGAGDP